MPPGKSPQLYNLKKTTIWFAFASILLLVGLIVMLLQDSTREWKSWQREFVEYSRHQSEADLEKAEKAVDQKKLDELKTQISAAEKTIATHQSEMARLQQDISAMDLELGKAKVAYQGIKQVQDSDRYFFEEYRAHNEKEKTERYEKRLNDRAPELDAAKLKVETLEAEREKKTKALEEFTKAKQELERDFKKADQDVIRVEKKVEKLKPSWTQAILNAPMLDFMKPTLQIQQIVLENLQDDYYFTKVQKVDRCITCHLGVDQKGFEDAPAPFKTHPKLDLFLSPASPHPMETFGCTTCHGGSGHSVSFVTAAHTPKNNEQAKEWEKKYDWHPMKHWGEKMLPLNHVEAACAKCHTGVVDVPQAPKLNEGRHLARTFGCFNCHKVEGAENQWKVGPNLTHIQSKLEQDWIVRWLHNPKEFRPSTKMPRIFHLSNTSDPASADKNNAAIAGIATYLVKNSDPVSLKTPPVKGNPEIGEKLVKEIGCLGCHTVGSLAANNHGPELSGLGSKVKADWLFSWLKDPKHFSPDTRMPNLRLSDEEASHITSYLLAQKNEKFESVQIPHVKPEAVDELATVFLTGKMRFEEAKAELAKMNPDEKLEYIGKQSIAHQGCFGCHSIKGFEDTKPIGTELSEEGSKEVDRLDFGFINIDHTREAWFFQKLKAPRIFDEGKVKTYHEKLRMPQFDFTDAQAESLTTFLLSLQKTSIPLEMKKRLDVNAEKVEEGRFLVTKLNCQGCHTLDGKEGGVRSIIEDKGNAPPVINGEGKKVQAGWLYHFLEAPKPIRPWLHYRMPTFDFDDKDLTTLVEYFHHLDQVPVSFKPEAPISSAEEVAAGHELFKNFQCIKCHQSKPDAALSASFLAPNLTMAKDRLRAEWVRDWLKDPQVIQPGTMMPSFFPEGQSPVKNILDGDYLKQIKALRDYLWIFNPETDTVAAPPQKAPQSK